MVTDTARNALEYYLSLKYPVNIEEAPEGGYFVQIKDLPGCYSQGETIEEALKMIEEARCLWLESMYEDGNEIPLPGSETANKYSGKFNVRVPRSLHRKLDEMAEKEGVSLNHFLVSTLSRAVGQKESQSGRARKVMGGKHSQHLPVSAGLAGNKVLRKRVSKDPTTRGSRFGTLSEFH